MQKRAHITYTAISQYCLFVLRYQHQVLDLMCLVMVRVILPGSRWNSLPPGNLTRLARTARQGLKPILE